MQTLKSAVFVLGSLTMCSMSIAAGAAAASSGGGVSTGGGGHASGGGGSVSTGGASGGGAAAHVGPSQSTASPANASPSRASSPSNPHSSEHHDHRSYPYGFGYPYSSTFFGYGSGDGYGDGYNNGNNYNNNNSQPLYDNSSPTVSTDQGTAGTAAVSPADPNAAARAAQLQNAADHSPALLQAQADVQQAQQEFDAAKARVLAQLRTQPDYQAALSQRHSAGAEVRQVKAADPNNMNSVTSAAESKLQAGDAVTKMEEAAVDNDPEASAAKAKLADAMTKLAAMRGSAGVR